MDRGETQAYGPWCRNWQSWLGYVLLLVVLAAVAQPVWGLIELFCAFSHMGPT